MLSTVSTVSQNHPNRFPHHGTARQPMPTIRPATGALGLDELEVFTNTRSNIRTFKAGHTLIQQGEPCTDVYVLLEGWAICQKILEDGGRQILDLVLPGNIFGFNLNGGAPYGIETRTDCRAVVLSHEAFKDLLLRAPSVCLKCAEVFASAEMRAFERLSQVGRLSAKERVAGLIVELAIRLKTATESFTSQIELPLTQLDIADMLGLAHETVCRVLVSLRSQKLTTWRNGRLDIHNLEKLMNLAGIDPDSPDYDFCRGDKSCPRISQAA